MKNTYENFTVQDMGLDSTEFSKEDIEAAKERREFPITSFVTLMSPPPMAPVIERASLAGLSVRDVRVSLHYVAEGCNIRASMAVLCVTSSRPTIVEVWDGVPLSPKMSDDEKKKILSAAIRKIVITLLTHEVDEQLFVDGIQVTSPHGEPLAKEPEKAKEDFSWFNRSYFLDSIPK